MAYLCRLALYQPFSRGKEIRMRMHIDDAHIHDGHRSRMRHKLKTYGQRIFDTYELLEMLLYYVIPYRDTNPVAKNLLYAFGNLDGVFTAERERLLEVNGIGERTAEFIASVGSLRDIIGAEIIGSRSPQPLNYESVGKMLVDYFDGSEEKQVVALFFDSGMRLIRFEKIYDLEYESGGVKAKPFIDEAILCNAAAVITAHNHPYGPFYPTPGDRATNVVVTEGLAAMGILHAEHYIVSGDCYAGLGSLGNFAAKLSQMPAVSEFVNSAVRNEGRVNRTSGTNVDCKSPSTCKNTADSGYFTQLLGYASVSDYEKRAELLLDKYGTVENVLTAPERDLAAIAGESAALFIKLIAYVTSRRITDKISVGERYSSAAIAEYLKAIYIGESVEKTYLIAFDESDRLLGVELLGEGTVNASEVIPRKAIEIATLLMAKSVSLSHNHPFGTTSPSDDDVVFTKTIAGIFETCEILFREHFIIAGQLCDTIDFEL